MLVLKKIAKFVSYWMALIKRPKYVLVGAVLQFTIMPLFLALLALFSSLLSYTIFVAMSWDMV